MTPGRPSAALLVTGQELLLGLVADANTQFLAHELDALGIELQRVSVVGDARDEIVAGLRELAAHDLVITSGGLGPTHDDRTVEAVAEVAGAELAVDEQLLATIAEITAGYARRRGTDPALNRDGDRKQALVPHGATVIPPAGTAPGLLLPLGSGQVVLVLPGPPRELATVWRSALELEPIADLRARAGALLRSTLRVYGVGEPAVARAFAAVGGDAGGTRTTICARLLEVEVTVRAEPESAAALEALVAGLHEQLGEAMYAEDERPLAEHVLAAMRERGLHIAVAESCTAGLVGAALASIPGSSDVLLGGVIAYANEVKRSCWACLRSCSPSTAPSRPRSPGRWPRVRGRRRAPRSRSPSPAWPAPEAARARKPVGLVYLHVSAPGVERGQELHLPGDRAQVREVGGGCGAPARAHDGFVTPRAVAAYPGR